MKKDIHPTYYYDAKVTCACGNTWTTGSTKKEIKTEVCSKCHPFFTGQQQRLLDIEGQVDRFYRRLQARQDFINDKKSREDSKDVRNAAISELGLNNLSIKAWADQKINKVADFLDIFEKGGDKAVLDLQGIGQSRLIEIKKALRAKGIDIPGGEE
jgi:large subunit ribosomal protein L31